MEKFLNKKYKLDEADENFNDYLTEIGSLITSRKSPKSDSNRCLLPGMNFVNRKIAESLPTRTQVVKVNEHEYTINISVPFLTHQQRFVPGKIITKCRSLV